MALEDIIAQRIAAMSAARMRMEATMLDPINQIGDRIRANKERAEARALQTRSLDLQERGLAQREAEFEAEQVGVPEVLARPVAESFVPKPAPISGGDLPAPFSAPAAFGNPAQTAIRREKIDAITSALGARGGANLMAKLAAYSALNKAQQAEAAERLKMTSMMAAAAGGPKALRPDMDPEGAAAGLTQYRADQSATNDDGAAEDAWWQKWGPAATRDPSKLPDDALRSMPGSLRKNLGTRAGQEERFETSMAFKRQVEAQNIVETAKASARADEFLKLGKDREARLEVANAYAGARKSVADFQKEYGTKTSEIGPNGEWIEKYRVDVNTLDAERKAVYEGMLRTRDSLAARVGAPTPTADGNTSTSKVKFDPNTDAEALAIKKRLEAGEISREEAGRLLDARKQAVEAR